MTIEKVIHINCTAQEIWAYLTEFKKMQEWNVCLLESKNISSGDLKAGFKSSILMKEGKKNVWYENEIIKYEPYSILSIALKGETLGKSRMFVNYDIKSMEEGIEVRYNSNWEPKGFFMKLFKGQIRKAMDNNVTKDLNELKSKIESK